MRKIFCSEFNQFQRINATQAWSLFLSVSNHQHLLGDNPAIGRYLTVGILGMLMAVLVEIIVH
ncbi:MAG: hypothetical protein WCO45_04735 [Pseudanabaena sp. ELA607]|jgi:hypothetical protein